MVNTTYNATYSWGDIAGSLQDSVDSVTEDEAVASIAVTLIIILAIVVIAKRVVHG